jgi:hypothetical protein
MPPAILRLVIRTVVPRIPKLALTHVASGQVPLKERITDVVPRDERDSKLSGKNGASGRQHTFANETHVESRAPALLYHTHHRLLRFCRLQWTPHNAATVLT